MGTCCKKWNWTSATFPYVSNIIPCKYCSCDVDELGVLGLTWWPVAESIRKTGSQELLKGNWRSFCRSKRVSTAL
jgi:hypothetical protein